MPKETEQLISQLMENNIALQEKTTDLINEIKDLVKKMDAMVNLFQDAAKHIKEGTDQPLMSKLQELLEQNRTIARGLVLLEKYVRERTAMGEQFSAKPLKGL